MKKIRGGELVWLGLGTSECQAIAEEQLKSESEFYVNIDFLNENPRCIDVRLTRYSKHSESYNKVFNSNPKIAPATIVPTPLSKSSSVPSSI